MVDTPPEWWSSLNSSKAGSDGEGVPLETDNVRTRCTFVDSSNVHRLVGDWNRLRAILCRLVINVWCLSPWRFAERLEFPCRSVECAFRTVQRSPPTFYVTVTVMMSFGAHVIIQLLQLPNAYGALGPYIKEGGATIPSSRVFSLLYSHLSDNNNNNQHHEPRS